MSSRWRSYARIDETFLAGYSHCDYGRLTGGSAVKKKKPRVRENRENREQYPFRFLLQEIDEIDEAAHLDGITRTAVVVPGALSNARAIKARHQSRE